jgi:hypothetical protein
MTAALHYSQHAASKTSEIEKYSIIALCSMIGALPNSAWLEGSPTLASSKREQFPST